MLFSLNEKFSIKHILIFLKMVFAGIGRYQPVFEPEWNYSSRVTDSTKNSISGMRFKTLVWVPFGFYGEGFELEFP